MTPQPEPEPKTHHASMLVTRAEEWCVEAESPGEARELLAAALAPRLWETSGDLLESGLCVSHSATRFRMR